MITENDTYSTKNTKSTKNTSQPYFWEPLTLIINPYYPHAIESVRRLHVSLWGHAPAILAIGIVRNSSLLDSKWFPIHGMYSVKRRFIRWRVPFYCQHFKTREKFITMGSPRVFKSQTNRQRSCSVGIFIIQIMLQAYTCGCLLVYCP